MDLYALQQTRGGHVHAGGRAWRGPGPGHSRHDDSLSVRIADDGRVLVHSFAGDDFLACASYLGLQRASRLDDAAAEELRRRRMAEQNRAAEESRAFVEKIWAGAQPVAGTQAEAYLFSRGLILDTEAVRYHPAAPRDYGWRRSHPAMVALAVDIFGRPRAAHCTYLRGGAKALGDRSRLIFGQAEGCAVRLSPVGPGGTLAIGEGLETSASFAALSGVPAWSALSSSGLQNVLIPAGVRSLVIAADGDEPGWAAAQKLSRRVRTSPRRLDCEIRSAPNGRDWNDVLAASAQAPRTNTTRILYAAT